MMLTYDICLEPWSFRKTKKGRTIKVWKSRAAYKQYMLESEFAAVLTAEITREINNEIITEIYKFIGVENTKDTRTDLEKSIQTAFDKIEGGFKSGEITMIRAGTRVGYKKWAVMYFQKLMTLSD